MQRRLVFQIEELEKWETGVTSFRSVAGSGKGGGRILETRATSCEKYWWWCTVATAALAVKAALALQVEVVKGGRRKVSGVVVVGGGGVMW